jgi:TetR/AcrR family transcriptional repressor of nem operon
MKVSRAQARAHREHILVEAARLLRERGLAGVGVDAITRAAGLTHGSIYSQFGGREPMVAEALSHGSAQAAHASSEIDSLNGFVSQYLSVAHRDAPGRGCFMAALGCEMGRQGKEVRHAFTEIVRANVARVGRLLPGQRRSEDRALATVAMLVGALVLARGVDDGELSERLLAAARTAVLTDR